MENRITYMEAHKTEIDKILEKKIEIMENSCDTLNDNVIFFVNLAKEVCEEISIFFNNSKPVSQEEKINIEFQISLANAYLQKARELIANFVEQNIRNLSGSTPTSTTKDSSRMLNVEQLNTEITPLIEQIESFWIKFYNMPNGEELGGNNNLGLN